MGVAGKGSKSRINSPNRDKRLLGPIRNSGNRRRTNAGKHSTLATRRGQVLFGPAKKTLGDGVVKQRLRAFPQFLRSIGDPRP